MSGKRQIVGSVLKATASLCSVGYWTFNTNHCQVEAVRFLWEVEFAQSYAFSRSKCWAKRALSQWTRRKWELPWNRYKVIVVTKSRRRSEGSRTERTFVISSSWKCSQQCSFRNLPEDDGSFRNPFFMGPLLKNGAAFQEASLWLIEPAL